MRLAWLNTPWTVTLLSALLLTASLPGLEQLPTVAHAFLGRQSSVSNAFLIDRDSRPVSYVRLDNERSSRQRAIHIPLLKDRKNGLHVSLRLNNKKEVPFLVDTGATYSVITPELADSLGIKIPANGPSITLATANGLTKAPLVTIARMSVDGYELKNVQVVIRPLGDHNLEFDGLLGLNFFQDMDFSVRRDRLELSVAF